MFVKYHIKRINSRILFKVLISYIFDVDMFLSICIGYLFNLEILNLF